MKTKRLIMLLAAIILMTMCFAFGASAEERTVIETGNCGANGDNVTYVLYDDGEIVISGEGAMKNYTEELSPFSYYQFITINDGITSIGDNTFSSISTIIIPDSINYIGSDNFHSSAFVFYAGTDSDWNSIVLGENNYMENTKLVTDASDPYNLDASKYIMYAEKEDGTIKINNTSRLFRPVGDVVIPDTIDGYTVTEIGYFSTYGKVDTCTIPDTVEKIFSLYTSCDTLYIGKNVKKFDYFTFKGVDSKEIVVHEDNPYFASDKYGVLYNKDFTKLIAYPKYAEMTTYEIPDTITTLDYIALKSLGSLETLMIPESVSEIDDGSGPDGSALNPLYGSKLKAFIVDENNKHFSSIGGILFNKTGDTLIRYPNGKGDEVYIIPSTVKTISCGAFRGTHSTPLTLVIPSTVERMKSESLNQNGDVSIKFYGSYKEWRDIAPPDWSDAYHDGIRSSIEYNCHADHADYNNDNCCDFCNEEVNNSTETPVEPCNCNCHAGGIKAFFFKFINFFEKLFGKNKICKCGAKH